MLVHIKEIIKKAQRGKYAVGAFNVNNLEMVLAVIRAAEKAQSPAIIQMTEGAIEYAGLEELVALIKAAAGETRVPLAIHLDHGHSPELIKKCVQIGFSSVMIDASAYPYQKNVHLTKNIVKLAHAKGVWVQAELGRLEGLEDWVKVGQGEGFFTVPADAKRFARETGINVLAVAIGNYHGVQKVLENKVLKLDLKRLARIAKIVSVPLVLHGASGFPGSQIRQAIKLGIRIINIDSDLRIAFIKAEKGFLQKNKDVFDPRKILTPAIEAMQDTIIKKMKMFGSYHKT